MCIYKQKWIRTVLFAAVLAIVSFYPPGRALAGPESGEEGLPAITRKAARRVKEAGYLADACGYLDGKDYSRARESACEVLRTDPSNREAVEMVAGTQRLLKKEAEAIREHARGKIRAVREAELAAKKKEAEKKRGELAARKYTAESRKHLEKGNFSDARRDAHKARESDPLDPEVPALIEEIDRSEMFDKRSKEETARQARMKKAEKKAEVDVCEANKGGRGWIEWITETLKDKKYELGEIRADKVYTIDECVLIALSRSPRLNMADKQIKLAEMRVWEAYRDLLPSITARYEMSSGEIGADNMVRHYRGNKYQIELKQNIFDGMEKWFAMRQARTNLDIVELEKRKVENEIVEETKKAYYHLDKTFKARDMQEKSREEVNGYYDLIDKTFQGGYVPRTE
ncbi:MAG: TolC family protein, partial [Candidatus Omnitrophica bacterium]|nr:TolC family protein [Candidatus Omnitrophota bacterium]